VNKYALNFADYIHSYIQFSNTKGLLAYYVITNLSASAQRAFQGGTFDKLD